MSQVGQTLHVPSNIPHPEHGTLPQTEQALPRPESKRAIGHRVAEAIVGVLYDEHRGRVAHVLMGQTDRNLLGLTYLDKMSDRDFAERTGVPSDKVTRRLI